jgi:hypothetical protein
MNIRASCNGFLNDLIPLQWSLEVVCRPTPVQQGVSHTVALPFTLKVSYKAKEESSKLRYFTMQKST